MYGQPAAEIRQNADLILCKAKNQMILWSATGTLLGSVTFSSESASGWQQAMFASPIAIAANTTYVASYHTNSGFYAATTSGLTNAVDNAPLHALATGSSGGNGVYSTGAASAFAPVKITFETRACEARSARKFTSVVSSLGASTGLICEIASRAPVKVSNGGATRRGCGAVT